MTVPPWKTPRELEQAFADFVIEKLDEADQQLAEELAKNFIERSADPAWSAKAAEQFEAHRLARKHGGTIAWEEDKRPRGPRKEVGPLARATRDVPRIRAIFRLYWPEHERRTSRPTAVDIAASRWNLSEQDKDVLHRRFNHD